MADEEELFIGGKPISTLRVVDLKKECDKRGLSKSGSKSQILERLKTQMLFENLHSGQDSKGHGRKVEEDSSQNEFIKQYLAQQKQLIENAESSMTSSSQESDGDESPKKHSKPTEKSPPIRSPPLEISPEKPVPMEIQHETTEETSGKEEAQHQVPSQVEKKRQIEEKKPTEVEEGPALGRGRRRLFRLEVDSKREETTDSTEPVKTPERRSRRSRTSASTGSEHEDSGSQCKAAVNSETQDEIGAGDAKPEEAHPVLEHHTEQNGEALDKTDTKYDRQRKVEAKEVEEHKSEEKKENFKQQKTESEETKDPKEPKQEEKIIPSRNDVTEVEKTDVESKQKNENRMVRVTEVPVDQAPTERKEQKQRSQDQKPVGKSRVRSSSSSSSSTSSRSRSRDKKSRSRSSSTSSSRSRSRSPAKQKKSSITVPLRRRLDKKDERSSSSSRSRSRSPSPKTESVEEHKPQEEKSKTVTDGTPIAEQAEKSDAERSGVKKNSVSRSSLSRSRSNSPVEKMSLEKPNDLAEEAKSKPTPDKLQQVVEKKFSEPDITQPQPETKVSKKISLNRKTLEDTNTGLGKTDEKPLEGEKVVKKRKWGSQSTSIQKPKKATSMPISTDSLKGLIPDIKPSLKLAPEPIMEDEMDYEDDTGVSEQGPGPMDIEDTRSVKIQRTVTQGVEKSEGEESEVESETGEAEEDMEKQSSSEEEAVDQLMDKVDIKREMKTDVTPKRGEQDSVMVIAEPEKEKKTITVTKKVKKDKKDRNREIKVIRRLESGGSALIKADEPERPTRSPSPARNPASTIVHVRNLVRPFTLNQLKELLTRHGKLIEESFWIDKIKSHCFASYETEEEAVKTREYLHNTRWPQSNPKTLNVDYAAQDQLDYYRGNNKPTSVPEKKTVAKVEKERAVEREKKVNERDKEIERRRKEREQRMREREEHEKGRPVREWDKDKKTREDWDRTLQKSRSRSPRVERGRRSPSPRERRRERSSERDSRREKKKVEKKDAEPPAKLLDDLFRKTKTTPCIYWLPLTEAQIAARMKTGYVRPVLRQRRGGDMVSPVRENPAEEERTERKRRSSSPAPKPTQEKSGERIRIQHSPPDRKRRDSSPTESRSRSNRRR